MTQQGWEVSQEIWRRDELDKWTRGYCKGPERRWQGRRLTKAVRWREWGGWEKDCKGAGLSDAVGLGEGPATGKHFQEKEEEGDVSKSMFKGAA